MDIELEFIKLFSNLKEIKNKKYGIYDADLNEIYVFKNIEEFKSYFTLNGVEADDELVRICTLKTTRKGNILALKMLCDHTIKRCRINKKLSSEEIEAIHKKGNITFEEKVIEWENNKICAPASKLRCRKFSNCHDCMMEYASVKNEYEKTKILGRNI